MICSSPGCFHSSISSLYSFLPSISPIYRHCLFHEFVCKVSMLIFVCICIVSSWRNGNEYLLTSAREVDQPKKWSCQSPAWWTHEGLLKLLTRVCMTPRQLHCYKPHPSLGDNSWKLRPWVFLYNSRLLYTPESHSPAGLTLSIIFGRSLWILYIWGIFSPWTYKLLTS